MSGERERDFRSLELYSHTPEVWTLPDAIKITSERCRRFKSVHFRVIQFVVVHFRFRLQIEAVIAGNGDLLGERISELYRTVEAVLQCRRELTNRLTCWERERERERERKVSFRRDCVG